LFVKNLLDNKRY